MGIGSEAMEWPGGGGEPEVDDAKARDILGKEQPSKGVINGERWAVE